MVLATESVDLADILAATVVLIAPVAAQNGVGIAGVPFAAQCVNADRHRLEQILFNLLANAVKYNRPDVTSHLPSNATTRTCSDSLSTTPGSGIPRRTRRTSSPRSTASAPNG